jgi:AcrR family transcriptional regulator
LQRVASDLGVTHSNLLYHFGSAAELRSNLMGTMVTELAGALDSVVASLHSDVAASRAVVDMVFDAFVERGAGRLAAWIALTDNLDLLKPIEDAVKSLVRGIEEKFAGAGAGAGVHRGVTSAVLLLALTAFGDSMIGGPLQSMLERDPAAPRKVVAFLLPRLFEST